MENHDGVVFVRDRGGLPDCCVNLVRMVLRCCNAHYAAQTFFRKRFFLPL